MASCCNKLRYGVGESVHWRHVKDRKRIFAFIQATGGKNNANEMNTRVAEKRQ